MRFLLITSALIAVLIAAPARAASLRELAQWDQAALVAHIMGSLDGAAAGFSVVGNQSAAQCVRRWAAPPAQGGHDPQALTDILTRFADALGRLKAGGRAPSYEDLLAAALRERCGTALPSG